MKKLLIFLMMMSVALLSACSISLGPVTSENTTTKLAGTYTTGVIMPPNTGITVDDNISSLQSQITATISLRQASTFAVINYHDIDTDDIEGDVAASSGSCVIYKKILNSNNTYTYYVLTNRHVTENGNSFTIMLGDKSNVDAELVGESTLHDVAILRFTSIESSYESVEILDNSDISIGQFVIAIGTPMSLKYYNTATLGIVSGIRDGLIQHDAAINSGNSGGPLYDIYGNLVGLNVSKLSENADDKVSIEGIGFAVAPDALRESIIEIEANDPGYEIKPVLGISVYPVQNILTVAAMTKEEYISQGGTASDYDNIVGYKEMISSDVTSGLLVTNVDSNGVSYRDGLEKYDVILSVDGNTISKNADIKSILDSKTVGETIVFSVNRLGKVLNITVTL